MNLSMTIRAKKYAFIDFLLRFFPTPSIAFSRNSEFFFAGFCVMEFQRVHATIIAASRASTTLVINRHLTDFLSSPLNGLE